MRGRVYVDVKELPSLTEGAADSPSIPRQSTLARRFRRHGLAVVSAVLMLLLAAILVAAPVLPLRSPNQTVIAKRLFPPLTDGYILGTDALGRDMLSRVVWGGRISLILGVAAAVGSMVMGVAMGLAAGYLGGKVDRVLSGLTDIVMAFPYILLGIGIVAALGPSLVNAMLAVSVTGFPMYMRVVRAAVLSVKQREFVEGAVALGAHPIRVVGRHILPNVVAPIIVALSLDVGEKVIATASLSFLGMGVQPPDADWGNMLAQAMNQVTIAPHVAIVPGTAIFLVVLCCNLMGDALRDALDPRLR